MVMFKAKFRPLVGKPAESDKPAAKQKPAANDKPGMSDRALANRRLQAQQQQQPQPRPAVPPIEEERGPQAPVREPEPLHEPERAYAD